MKDRNIIVIGAGLSGLIIAYQLRNIGISVRILEARNRIGGRILTLREEGEPSIEMGATWLGKKHNNLVRLLEELGVGIGEQYIGRKAFYEPMSINPPQLVDLPQNDEPSYRINGGTDTLIQALVGELEQGQIHLKEAVRSVVYDGRKFHIETGNSQYSADLLISTIPPKLLIDHITFTPALPDQVIEIASNTHTWMGESIKVALTFQDAFWRKTNLSGTIFSNVGPVTEMYDHSSENRFALKGFMNNAYRSVNTGQRKELVIDQLRRYFSKQVNNYTSYHELVWQDEEYTFSPYSNGVIPHQNNGHKTFQQPFFDGKLILSGSETANTYPGYMDGAVESANNAVKYLQEMIL